MPIPTAPDRHHIGSVEFGGQRYTTTCRIAWDGLEYVGRLWFINDADPNDLLADRSALPGRTTDEVVALARRLTQDELNLRLSRAHAEKRRYIELRRVTDLIIAKIRYMNQVAISINSGVLDGDAARGEIDLTEKQLHELVDTLREHAGLER